jgi:hypothetical protein
MKKTKKISSKKKGGVFGLKLTQKKRMRYPCFKIFYNKTEDKDKTENKEKTEDKDKTENKEKTEDKDKTEVQILCDVCHQGVFYGIDVSINRSKTSVILFSYDNIVRHPLKMYTCLNCSNCKFVYQSTRYNKLDINIIEKNASTQEIGEQ